MEFARLSAGNRPPAGDAAPRSSKRAMRLKFYAALVLSDTLAVLVGTAAASALRFGALDHAQGQLLAAIIREQGWRAPITVSKRSGLIDAKIAPGARTTSSSLRKSSTLRCSFSTIASG